MTASNALRWPVSSPWRLRRYGDATAYLSSRQRALLLYVAATGKKRGRRTLEELAGTLGVTSRGQVSRELRRLRQLELIGYKASHGSKGSHLIWIGRTAARLRALRMASQGPIDSVSTPFGGFISRSGVERAWRSGRQPPRRRPQTAGDGPRRGHDPPRVLYARCPLGHTARLPRGPWTKASSGGLLRAEWSGICRRCGDRPIREVVELELVPVGARPLSAAELADPELLERRRRRALEAIADPTTPLEVVEQLRRDYVDRPAGPDPAPPGPLADELERFRRRP